VNASDKTANDTKPSIVEIIRTRWLSFRRKRFWVLFALLLYTVLGFFVAPLIIKNSVIDLFQVDLGRTAQVEKVEVNPFVLSLRVSGFEVEDKDDTRLAAFTEFYVNFQLSSLFNRAWTFRDIRLVEPYFFVERFDETDSRLGRIATDFANSRPVDNSNQEDLETENSMPRLLIHDLVLSGGHMDLKDNLPGTAVETRLAPINVSIQGLNTLPDRDGNQSVTIQLPDNASLKWGGSVNLAPFESQGELELDGLHLDPAFAYLQSMIPALDSVSATLSTRFQYRVYMDLGGQVEVDVKDMAIELDNLAVTGLTPVEEFISIPKVSLSGGTFRYPQQSLRFSTLKVDKPNFVARLDENGSLNLADLAPAGAADTDNSPVINDNTPWQFDIDELQLDDVSVEFSDSSIQPNAAVGISNLQVSLTGLNIQRGTQIPIKMAGDLVQGGSFNLTGMVSMLPDVSVSANLSTRDLPLAIGQPYVAQYANIEVKNGILNTDIEMSFAVDQNLTASGSISIPDLAIDDSLDQQGLLIWDLMNIDQFNFNRDTNSLHFSQVFFDNLFGKFLINEDKTTNISELLIEQSNNETASDTNPMNIIIGGIQVKDSSMDFSDMSLPLPFATHIINLDGSISTIDTGSDTPANIRFEGQVDEFGLARINGAMNVFDPIRHTDVTVEFRNLLMSNLSPYTVQFAGREIDEGKLDLDLVYKIDEGQLHGENNVVMSELVLGQKIDHPDAASLPLGLAVSLLKDADGVIKVDLPVEGDINDPEFQIGGVVWQAISGMITKLVSAPFRLLGNLIGIDSEDLGQFEFLAGRSDLTPPELEKVIQLEKALEQRPELVIEISGVMHRRIDAEALKRIKLVSIATERLGEEFDSQDAQSMMLDDEIRSLVEKMFSERFPDIDKAGIKTQHTAPPPTDPEGAAELDELAYATALWDQMLEAVIVTDQDLADLAQARAQVIKDAFLSSGEFAENRVVIAEPKEVESEDEQWVVLELTVASK
jgi:hypothetical protein